MRKVKRKAIFDELSRIRAACCVAVHDVPRAKAAPGRGHLQAAGRRQRPARPRPLR